MKLFNPIHFPSMSRWLPALAILVVAQLVEAQSWQATTGAQNQSKRIQALAFLPNEIWIHAGDTVNWNFAVDEVHTVTFLANDQIRLSSKVGCPGTTADGSPFDGSTCVNGGRMTKGQTYSVTFPVAGNFKLTCLVHTSMTGVVHVLDPAMPLPHDQAFYDDQAAVQQKDLLHSGAYLDRHQIHSHGNEVTAGVGEIVATQGGPNAISIMRFEEPDKIVHVGDTVEWTNSDPIVPHTMTFGVEPADLVPPSANVTVDADGARHAVISSTADNVNSGWIVASGHERTGVAQAPLGVTRFRVTFTQAGVFHYICGLHDILGMKGKVIVVP
jgi:plastocyanin